VPETPSALVKRPSVLVEDSAEAVASPDVESGQLGGFCIRLSSDLCRECRCTAEPAGRAHG